MKLRRFNEAGIRAIREQLALLRASPDRELPNALLEHRELTEVVQPEIQISHEHFQTKGEAARYLSFLLLKRHPEEITNDAGLWTWLAIVLFDSVCPASDGRRKVKGDACYIYEPRNVRHFYRHFLFVSWRVLRLAPVHNHLFLSTRLDSLDSATAEVMQRLHLLRIPCIFEVVDRLYWDPRRERPVKGRISSKIQPGNLRYRLPSRIRQLEKTYDLMSLNADQLLELLGDEFSFARRQTAKLFDDAIH